MFGEYKEIDFVCWIEFKLLMLWGQLVGWNWMLGTDREQVPGRWSGKPVLSSFRGADRVLCYVMVSSLKPDTWKSERASRYHIVSKTWDKESDNTGSLGLPELMLSQVFRLLKFFHQGTPSPKEIRPYCFISQVQNHLLNEVLKAFFSWHKMFFGISLGKCSHHPINLYPGGPPMSKPLKLHMPRS